ncbi:MAG: alpha-E domain-containing protein [Caulobacterales bacterium]
MLGKTAGGLLWMARYLERSENIARLVDAGFRIALTRAASAEDEWSSILATAAAQHSFVERYKKIDGPSAINYLLRDKENPSSVLSAIESARSNARLVRTALTREVWESVNVCWMTLKEALSRPVQQSELPALLGTIRQQSALVRGAMHGTMLRNDIYNFVRIGTLLERADNTSRILDVKYYVLLPAASSVGSELDNVQWETILRCTSAERAFGWLHGGEVSPTHIAEFLILDRRMPRSLAFCYHGLLANLTHLQKDLNERQSCIAHAHAIAQRLETQSIQSIFSSGLHEFISDFIRDNSILARRVEEDYRFYG